MSNRIQPVNRQLTSEEIDNFALCLARAGYEEARRAVNQETERIAKVILLDAIHNINPLLAIRIAKAERIG